MQDDGSAVGHSELVVSGRDGAPLLEVAVAAFDCVAVLAVGGVEADGPAAARAPPSPVAFLVLGFGDDGFDPTGSQVHSDRS